MSRIFLRVLLPFSLGLLSLQAQDPYDCGSLNQRACTTSDFERTNMAIGQSRKCELDLKEVDGYCRNDKRDTTFVRNSTWTGWASENQLLSISKDTPINFITWPATHNAFANTIQGFNSDKYTNQALSITDQLNRGSRHLELDPKIFNQFLGNFPLADPALRVCHSKYTALCYLPFYGNRLFGFVLKEVADWVDANPGQVVYLKIDNMADSGDMAAIETDVQRYLGNRVVPAPNAFVRWPTIQEIRNAGKSIMVVHHNASNNTSVSSRIWNATGLVQTSNRPADQNFDTCTANDGYNPNTRSQQAPTTWWDTAEGRAKTNSGDSATGLFWESEVEKAANCGVSVIGLDFFWALDSDLNISPRSGADNRLKETIWSWSENDFGRNGPAYQEPTTGTWVSFNAASVLPVACALKRPYGSPLQDRGWKITSSSIPWNLGVGNARCAEEFNNGTEEYGFAYPANGWQNRKLREVAAGRKVWLAYSVLPIANGSYSTSKLVYRMNPGGQLPAAQTLRIGAAPGTTIEAKTVGNVPIVYSIPSSPFATGEFALDIAIGASAANLPAGEYVGSLDLSLRAPFAANPEIFSLALRLVIRRQTTLHAFPSVSTAVQGQPIELNAQILNGVNPTGSIKFYRIFNANGISTGQETVAFSEVVAVSNAVKPTVSNLPLGLNTYLAAYTGDGSNLESESDPFTVNVTTRIVATPPALTINTVPNTPQPNQVITFTGLGASPVVENPSCSSWLRADLVGSSLTVGLRPGAVTFAQGTYVCTLTVKDALSAQGGGQTNIVVTFNMQTPLSATPGSISLYGATPSATNVTVTAGGNANIALTSITSPQPWILGEALESMTTPSTVAIYIDPAKLPIGISTGQLVITSQLAPTLTIPVTFNKVNPSVVTSVPVGRLVSVDGAIYTTPANFIWQPGSTHTISALSPQLDGGSRFKLSGWKNGNTPAPSQPFSYTAVAEGTVLMASFDTDYLLSTDVAPSNSGTLVRNPSSADSYYAPGALVQLVATPAANYTFSGFLGDLTGTNPTGTVSMNGPRSVAATFSQIQPISVTITSATPGAQVSVNGTSYPLPASLLWTPGTAYQLSAAAIVNGGSGTQYVYASWSNSGAQHQTITAPGTPLNLVISYQRQFLLSASASPQLGGSLNGGGWYNEGAMATLSVSASNGYSFSGFSGDLSGTATPASVLMSAPRTAVANFAVSGTPTLSATTGGARIDGPNANQRVVPIQLSNTGSGVALHPRITGITGITTVTGTGTVTLLSLTPVLFDDLIPGALGIQPLLFDWPATAQRVRITVNYSSDNGVPGATTLTIIR
ncbi:InlB B-repeat-containing protein [Bryobacter aggregatus]|uniref:InlB B-repeat-containing protein n=1 Tax=Bryobacter aggregatus TaxID=360054 RepID=UPI0004E12088|nr:Ig-like domain repeat protein [Bryobacter aggregatus]